MNAMASNKERKRIKKIALFVAAKRAWKKIMFNNLFR